MVGTLAPISHEDCQRLADALGDTPQTVIAGHLLRRGLCDAYLLGDLSGAFGVIVRDPNVFGEPTAFGNAPKLIWQLLRALTGWFCVDLAAHLAKPVGELIEKHMGVSVRYYGDLYFTLTAPVRPFEHDSVRLLTLDDLPMLEAAQDSVQGKGFGGPRQLLENGFAACGIVNNQVGAIAETYARTERHADVGVSTLPQWRGRGFATAAASIVAGRLQEAGQIPVWSTGEDNYASQHVARKLGFAEVSREAYVVIEQHN